MTKEEILKASRETLMLELRKLQANNSCNNCYNCNNCYSCDYCYSCDNCSSCNSCNNCDYCNKQSSKSYMILNIQLTEEEYLEYKKK